MSQIQRFDFELLDVMYCWFDFLQTEKTKLKLLFSLQQVAILSMHQSDAPNWTAVVFGALPDPINALISPVSLSVLRSSLIEVFLNQTNLTLTTTIFGQPSGFEILKFQGGVTVIPLGSASIWRIPQILFNFTLNNSISEILENVVELKEQLKFGLHLRPYEVCHQLN